MRLLIATRNRDKYEIVRRMVEAVSSDAHSVFLGDTSIEGDVVEAGTIAERATQKAAYFMARLEWSAAPDEFDAVLAIDDGLSVDGSEATPNSKELTDRILGAEWTPGTAMAVVRAYALIKRGEVPRVEVTTLPFRFLGNPAQVERKPGEYPLSRVLAPEGNNTAVSDMARQDEDRFNLEHSASALVRLLS